MRKSIKSVVTTVELIIETYASVGINLKIEEDAMHFIKSRHNEIDDIKAIIFEYAAQSNARKHNSIIIRNNYLTNRYINRITSGRARSVSVGESAKTLELLNAIEDAYKLLLTNAPDSHPSIEDIAREMNKVDFFGKRKGKQMKQHLYAQIRLLAKPCIIILSDEKNSEKWPHTRSLRVIRRMLSNEH
jgi:hypothetical protein